MTRENNHHKSRSSQYVPNRVQGRGPVIYSNCGEIKLRGNIYQIVDNYFNLAAETKDISQKEMFMQHAEHYVRMQNHEVVK